MRPLTRSEIRDLSDRIVGLLSDPSADLSSETRARWEGAASALAWVLGEANRLPVSDPERFGL
jgi:hypothetical protein